MNDRKLLSIFLLFIAIIFLLSGCESGDKLSGWTGFYNYYEFSAANLNLDYNIHIYKEKSRFFADITLDNKEDIVHVKAKITGDEKAIDFQFDSFYPDNTHAGIYQKGNVLFSFQRMKSLIAMKCGKLISVDPDLSVKVEKVSKNNPPYVDIPDLNDWVGNYRYYEFSEPNIYMNYNIDVYKERNGYFAEVTVDGFHTTERLKAKLLDNKEKVDFIFDSYRSESSDKRYQKGDVLFRLHKGTESLDQGTIEWGKMIPVFPNAKAKIGEVTTNQSETSENSDLNVWIGNYDYYEFCEPNINLVYQIHVFQEKSIYAEVDVEGFQTSEHLKAKISGDKNHIEFSFDSYYPDNAFQSYQKGDVLFSFQRNGSDSLIEWGKLSPFYPYAVAKVGGKTVNGGSE